MLKIFVVIVVVFLALVGSVQAGIMLTVHSPENITYSNKKPLIPIDVTSPINITKWWYQFNKNGTNITFTPNTTFVWSGGEGGKKIIVYAQNANGSIGTETVFFSVGPVSEYGGSGIEYRNKNRAAKKWAILKPSFEAIFLISKVRINVTKISFFVKNTTNNIEISVESFLERPKGLANAPGIAIQYLNISSGVKNDNLGSLVTIEFKVNNGWLAESRIGRENISLYRWSGGKWLNVSTQAISDSEEITFYRSEVDKLSYFVIAGIPEPVPFCGDEMCNGYESCEVCEKDCGKCKIIDEKDKCEPGENRCLGDTVQNCGSAEFWLNLTTCENGCNNATKLCYAPGEGPDDIDPTIVIVVFVLLIVVLLAVYFLKS